MKMIINSSESNEVWDMDSTDIEEIDYDESPNKVYEGSSSTKMENSAMKDKGNIKEDDREKFIEDINVTLWRNKRIRSIQFNSQCVTRSESLSMTKRLIREKSLPLPSDNTLVPSGCLKRS